MAMSSRSIRRTHLAGWLLFTLSAALFTLDSIRNGAVLLTVASIAFLVACFVFLAPLMSGDPEQ